MQAQPLYRQPLNPIYQTAPTMREFAQATTGANAGDLRFTNLDSINNCRMTKGTTPRHRIPAKVKPCSGYVTESRAGYNQHSCYSKKELRSLAIKVLRQRGITITDEAIAGILSGKTL